jgi:hypothetical protein
MSKAESTIVESGEPKADLWWMPKRILWGYQKSPTQARYRCLNRPMAREWFGRHSSSTAAENHEGQREAPFVPKLEVRRQAVERTQIPAGVTQRPRMRRELMRSSVVTNDLAIARDWQSRVVSIILLKPLRIECNRAWSPLMPSQTNSAIVWITTVTFPPASSFCLSSSGVISAVRNSHTKRCHRTSLLPTYLSFLL